MNIKVEKAPKAKKSQDYITLVPNQVYQYTYIHGAIVVGVASTEAGSDDIRFIAFEHGAVKIWPYDFRQHDNRSGALGRFEPLEGKIELSN